MSWRIFGDTPLPEAAQRALIRRAREAGEALVEAADRYDVLVRGLPNSLRKTLQTEIEIEGAETAILEFSEFLDVVEKLVGDVDEKLSASLASLERDEIARMRLSS